MTIAWDFDIDVVQGDITLYAKWDIYSKPTKITIEVPEDNAEVTFNYYIMQSSKLQIKWDNKEADVEFIENTDPIDPVLGATKHTYANKGIYIIEILTLLGSYTLGNHYTSPAIAPAKYVTAIDFAWDMVKTRPYAFFGATNLTELLLPSVMTQVDTGAFAGCIKLKTVFLSKNLVRISDQAFQGCSAIEGTLELPPKLTALGANAFDGCQNLTSIKINDKLERLTAYSFRDCSKVKTVYLANISRIDDQAFNNCASLEKITFNEALKTFGTNCFSGCSLLTTAGPVGSDSNVEFA